MSALGYIGGSLAICNFFVRNLSRLKRLEALSDEVNARLATEKSGFTMAVPKSLVETYNAELNCLRDTVKRHVPAAATFPREFSTAMVLFFGIRTLMVATALWASNPVVATFAASLLQFVVLPFSFHVALLHLVVLWFPLFGPHYAVTVALQAVVPTWASIYVEIGPVFISSFILADQLLCALLCIETPKGTATHKSAATVLKHFVYGFFNCKTYSLILLVLLLGFRINLTVWALDAVFGLSQHAAIFSAKHFYRWGIIFYHQHRLAHLPVVYNQAHKFHHYLHDTTAFDAHIYGAGAPEEYFSLLLEAGMALRFGLYPAVLSLPIVLQSVASKVGHTRTDGGAGGGVNHHADHHTLHQKNFGFGSTVFIDMIFGTNSHNNEYELGAFTVQLRVPPADDNMFLDFALTKRSAEETAEVERRIQGYYSPTPATCIYVVQRVLGRLSKAKSR